jgi:hypothetical protein
MCFNTQRVKLLSAIIIRLYYLIIVCQDIMGPSKKYIPTNGPGAKWSRFSPPSLWTALVMYENIHRNCFTIFASTTFPLAWDIPRAVVTHRRFIFILIAVDVRFSDRIRFRCGADDGTTCREPSSRSWIVFPLRPQKERFFFFIHDLQPLW